LEVERYLGKERGVQPLKVSCISLIGDNRGVYYGNVQIIVAVEAGIVSIGR
jgi:hypothetical protein